MINVKFKSKFEAKDLIRSVDRMLDQVKNKTYNTARSETPVRSGYAKSQWRKKDTSDGFSVSNAVDYIQFLDKGSSRQAPRGITKPTVRKITGFIRTRRLKR